MLLISIVWAASSSFTLGIYFLGQMLNLMVGEQLWLPRFSAGKIAYLISVGTCHP